MSFIKYVRGQGSGPATFLAVAAYDGLSAPFVGSLFESRFDVRLDLEIFSGNCHVDDSRNRLVRDFLETDCEQLIFLDADVSWLPNDLKRLIEHDADIVAGIYPLKSDDEDYPVRPLAGERWSNIAGLVEVEGVPTGFLKIRRKVFEALYPTVEKHKSREDSDDKMMIPVIFERTLNGRLRRGGDIEFCRKARKAGFKVYVDPMMQLVHEGKKLWRGCLGHWWRKDVAITEGMAAIREGRDGAETYLELYNVWGNNWAMAPEGLFALTALARNAKGPILECGSGLSTLCLAAATEHPIIALEHMATWACKIERMTKNTSVDMHLTDIKDYGEYKWYADVPKDTYDLVIIDGPPDSTGRGGIFQQLNGEIANATIVVDDIARAHWKREVDAYCEKAGRELVVMDCSKPFGIIK